MGLRKCPRCELNYIKEDQKYCNVCMRDMARESQHDDMMELCIECNENPVVPGSDYCVVCLREKRKLESMADIEKEDILGDDEDVVSDMDEIELDDDRDIPEVELQEIDRELCEDDEFDEMQEDSFERLAEVEELEPDEENI